VFRALSFLFTYLYYLDASGPRFGARRFAGSPGSGRVGERGVSARWAGGWGATGAATWGGEG